MINDEQANSNVGAEKFSADQEDLKKSNVVSFGYFIFSFLSK